MILTTYFILSTSIFPNLKLYVRFYLKYEPQNHSVGTMNSSKMVDCFTTATNAHVQHSYPL